MQHVPVAPCASVVCKLRPSGSAQGIADATAQENGGMMTPSPHATCHTQNAWVRMLPASSLVTPCSAAPASNTFATLACRSFAEDLQRSVFAPRFRDHHQMPFKNPLRRWRRIELPPVDAPLLPGESRIIESAMRQVLLTKVHVAVPVNLGSSAPDKDRVVPDSNTCHDRPQGLLTLRG